MLSFTPPLSRVPFVTSLPPSDDQPTTTRLITQTQEANRPDIRHQIGSFRVSAPSPLTIVCYTNPQNRAGLSVLPPATQHIYRSTSCALFYVLPLPLFLHRPKQVQTSNTTHRNFVHFSISSSALSLNVRVNLSVYCKTTRSHVS